MELTVADGVEAVSEMVALATDTLWRYLINRDDLSASAALVLNRLSHEGPMRVTALATAEGASQSGMTQLVQRLERQGLLERLDDPDDGRASQVMLSEGGKQNWDARAQVRKQRIAEWMPTVSEDDQVALWLASKVVVRVLSQMRGAAG
ncbi:MarR family winged helix-turn-helix transcriptional regulator [Mycolicibacterium pallens]|uniref:MarR family transcriptional regulator n=1 Tax=Mycolicibacterium pallens TaxID=370524 RepID=A0ABX8VB44_9MYCO|nr:MarR family transcriptional regulator [Mycolicibacterium pallens]APE14582.1 MarR family transcriptional regulator [Mycobacterium sp. WY10]QYL14917.1 MarR family transcriptional regulator [Mycolicibacterium pallens]